MYKSYEEMPVWKKAMDLAVAVHGLTASLPRSEDYGLASQLRRAALSVSANLAEGFGRKRNRDKANFYIMARGSLLETKSHITYGQKVGYFLEEQVVSLGSQVDEIWKEINSLLAFLENSLKPALSTPQPRPKTSARS